MNVLITGVAGFIGSNLARRLLAEGHSVIGIDNLSQGTLLNIADCRPSARFVFVQADVMNRDALVESARNVDVLYHLAAYKIPRYGSASTTMDVNVGGTAHAIHAAQAAGAHLIFASTSDVYGKNADCPFSEEHNLVIGPPNVPRWSYALSKAVGEQMIYAAAADRAFPFTIVRFFGGYGPGQHMSWWGGPQAVFINNVIDGKPLTLHGDGTQTRSFTYIDDHVDALVRIPHVDSTRGEVLNLGSDEEVTIRELGERIWRLMRDDSPRIELVPYETFGRYEDVRRRVPDNRKAKRLLGIAPQWTLDRGLKETIAWQVERRHQLTVHA
jgi:UDP-glucose 4-epimerase